MPIGVNGGSQLNVIALEVGLLIRDPGTGRVETVTVAVHPLHVAPRSISYSDRSRSSLIQTTGSSLLTVAGRALQVATVDGVFGVAARGVGPVLGNGELRFQRFRSEVVRLADALFRDDVSAALASLQASPGALAALARFQPGFTVPFVNWYDLWHRIAFSCQIVDFQFSKSASSATGLTSYRLQVREVGPVVATGLDEALLAPLFNGLATWDAVNDVLTSYSPEALTESALGAAGLAIGQLTSSLEAVTGALDDVQALMGAAPVPASSPAVRGFLAAVQRLVEATEGPTLRALASGGSTFPPTGPTVDWQGGVGALARYDAAEDLAEVADAARWQLAVGGLWGMGRGEYRRWIESGGDASIRDTRIAGAVDHVVSALDSEASLTARYAVSWDAILAANDLLPDEALEPGRTLRIPVGRAAGPQPIDGLPTFGSHVGDAAFGVDLDARGRLVDGRPALLSGDAVLVQGIDWIVAEVGDDLLADAQAFEAGRGEYIAERLSASLRTDRRIVQVDAVDVVELDVGVEVDVQVTSINGRAVRTGGGAAWS